MRNALRLAASVSIGIMVGSITVSAQKSAAASGMESFHTNDQPAVLFSTAKLPGSCPVSLRAQHGADGGFRKVDKSKPEGVAQLLHLILTSKDSRQIVEARLRVRGVSPKGRVSNADTADGANATRFVSVRFTPSGENEVSGKTWVPGLSAVLEVELNGVTFADASIQRFSSADGCRFIPDHLMLIANGSH
jgi:hypothetical protein